MKSIFFALLLLASCNTQSQDSQKTIKSIDEAKTYISEDFNDSIETMNISNSLNDKTGINMAIITEYVFRKGYTPAGFEQKDDYGVLTCRKDK